MKALDDVAQAILLRKAREVLAVYNAFPLEEEKSGYPFEKHDYRSVKDTASQSIRPGPGNSVVITITAVAARFLEQGNKPANGLTIKSPQGNDLFIKLKSGSGLNSKKGVVRDGFFVTKEVNPYAGKHPLKRAVFAVFGVDIDIGKL